MGHTSITVIVFLLLSLAYVLTSGAPLRVHSVDIVAFAISFVVPGIVAQKQQTVNPLVIWFAGGIFGIFFWDIGSAYVIVKRELFMGWSIVYPTGVVGLLLLQLLVKYISKKLLYNKAINQDAA